MCACVCVCVCVSVSVSVSVSILMELCLVFFQLRYLELLKLRFGESHLHFCEIMLKDIADSRRINAHIQSSNSKEPLLEVR